MSTRAPAIWWDLPMSAPVKNGLAFVPKNAQPHPADLIDAADTPPTIRELARDMLSWAFKMLDIAMEKRPTHRLTGRQIAIGILSGHPDFLNKSMRTIASETGLSTFGISKCIHEVAHDLFPGTENLMSDLRLKSDTACLNLSAGRIAHLRAENHHVRSIPQALETALRHFCRIHPEREADVMRTFPELAPES